MRPTSVDIKTFSKELTQELLKSLLYYDPSTGFFTWKVSPKGSWASVGDVAGGLTPKGYRIIRLFDHGYRAHRLAFLYVLGKLPEKEVDHKNGIVDDNRWENLRLCSHGENQQNKKLSKNNTSGIKGVSWHKLHKIWEVHVCINGKQTYLGCYHDLELADLVATEARNKHHNVFARHS